MRFFPKGKLAIRLKRPSPQPDEAAYDADKVSLSEFTESDETVYYADEGSLAEFTESDEAVGEAVGVLPAEFTESDEAVFDANDVSLPTFPESDDDGENDETKSERSHRFSAASKLLGDFRGKLDGNLKSFSTILGKRHPHDPESAPETYETEAETVEYVDTLPRRQWFSLNTAPSTEKWWSRKAIFGLLDDLIRHKTLTLTVENGVVRVVVFRGNQAIAWGSAHPFEDELPGAELGTFDKSFASKVYSLLMDMNFRRLRLVTEMPIYTPLIRNVRLPEIRSRYFNEVVLSEILETIPFSDDEVDVTWQRKSNENGHDVLAIVVPKSSLDEHVRMLQRENLQPGAVYPMAISLAAAAGLSNAIIIYANIPQAAIVLVRDALPKYVNQVNLPEDYGPYGEHAQLLSDGVEQISGYESTLEDVENGRLPLPVVLTGPLAAEEELAEEFGRISNREMLPFQPAINHTEYFSASEYTTNIGLLLADRMRSKSGGKIRGQNLPAVSLLSERHLPKPLPFKPVAVYMSIMIFGAVAFNLTPKVDSMALEASTLAERVESLEQRSRDRRLNQAQLNKIEEQIESFDLLEKGLQLRLDDLRSDMNRFIIRLEAITNDARPFGLNVSSMSLQGDELSISGRSLSYESVIEYTANLRDMGPDFFTQVKVEQVSSSSSVDLSSPDLFVLFQVKAFVPESLAEYGVEAD